MGKILPFPYEAAFEPDVTHAMGVAFDEVCRSLNLRIERDLKQDLTSEAVAKKILEFARAGEHDPIRLRDRALDALRIN